MYCCPRPLSQLGNEVFRCFIIMLVNRPCSCVFQSMYIKKQTWNTKIVLKTWTLLNVLMFYVNPFLLTLPDFLMEGSFHKIVWSHRTIWWRWSSIAPSRSPLFHSPMKSFSPSLQDINKLINISTYAALTLPCCYCIDPWTLHLTITPSEPDVTDVVCDILPCPFQLSGLCIGLLVKDYGSRKTTRSDATPWTVEARENIK